MPFLQQQKRHGHHHGRRRNGTTISSSSSTESSCSRNRRERKQPWLPSVLATSALATGAALAATASLSNSTASRTDSSRARSGRTEEIREDAQGNRITIIRTTSNADTAVFSHRELRRAEEERKRKKKRERKNKTAASALGGAFVGAVIGGPLGLIGGGIAGAVSGSLMCDIEKKKAQRNDSQVVIIRNQERFTRGEEERSRGDRECDRERQLEEEEERQLTLAMERSLIEYREREEGQTSDNTIPTTFEGSLESCPTTINANDNSNNIVQTSSIPVAQEIPLNELTNLSHDTPGISHAEVIHLDVNYTENRSPLSNDPPFSLEEASNGESRKDQNEQNDNNDNNSVNCSDYNSVSRHSGGIESNDAEEMKGIDIGDINVREECTNNGIDQGKYGANADQKELEEEEEEEEEAEEEQEKKEEVHKKSTNSRQFKTSSSTQSVDFTSSCIDDHTLHENTEMNSSTEISDSVVFISPSSGEREACSSMSSSVSFLSNSEVTKNGELSVNNKCPTRPHSVTSQCDSTMPSLPSPLLEESSWNFVSALQLTQESPISFNSGQPSQNSISTTSSSSALSSVNCGESRSKQIKTLLSFPSNGILSDESLEESTNIFYAFQPVLGKLPLHKLEEVLKNMGPFRLNEAQIQEIVKLADLDLDGMFDVEEFCIAYYLAKEYTVFQKTIPSQLNRQLIPETKRRCRNE